MPVGPGYFAYQSTLTDYTAEPTDAASYGTSQCIGATTSIPNQIIYEGIVPGAVFSTVGGAPTLDGQCWLELASNGGPGQLTADTTASGFTTGDVVAAIGYVVGNISGAGPYVADIMLRISAPIQL